MRKMKSDDAFFSSFLHVFDLALCISKVTDNCNLDLNYTMKDLRYGITRSMNSLKSRTSRLVYRYWRERAAV